MTAPTLEVAVDNLADAKAAVAAGARRLELCDRLDLDGLTPSEHLVVEALKLGVPVFAMVRPHDNGFGYSAAELQTMTAEIRALRKLGVHGLVFGALDGMHMLDPATNAHLLEACGATPATLHRAIDRVPDIWSALETAIQLGFTRILTSGGLDRAPEAATVMHNMQRHAGDRITILPGGGIRRDNVGGLLEVFPTPELHSSGRVSGVLDPDEVRALADSLNRHHGR